jgi:hypothetical protein
MKNVLARLQEFYQGQVRLQQLYLDRHETTGYEARVALRTLRWSGDELVGDWLPRCAPAGLRGEQNR